MPIPCFIIARDRFTMIRNTVEQVQRLGCVPIILDNDSKYPPLLEWYNNHFGPEVGSVIKLDEIYQAETPHRNLWKHVLPQWGIEKFKEMWGTEYYIVTDPDLDLSTLPDDTIDVLKRGLIQGCVYKCGSALCISDVHEDWREKVLSWECYFWDNYIELGTQVYFEAPIDTTFALYNIYNAFEQKYWDCSCKALRAGPPYVVRHIPWHVGKAEWTEEDRYYYDHMNKSISWTFSKDEEYNGNESIRNTSTGASESST